MKFCSNCGATVAFKIPAGDALPRHVCDACNTIHYLNPRMIVGCVPVWEDRVLLCKRAIEPRRGQWTVPAGFMENGETLAAGAARETLEEACARVEIHGLYAVYSIPHINQVYLLFRAQLLDLDFKAGEETLEARLFREDEIPWDQIAFATVRNTLTHYFADRARQQFDLHVGSIERPPVR
jgi:ADP-ribose pyrophosphatase YjhB (NUDIX family)